MRGTVSLLELISKSFLAEIGSSRPQMYLFREMLSKWYAGSNPEDPRLQRVLITAKTRAESILPACLELWMQLFMNPNQSESFATIPQRRISTLWYNLRLLWGCVLYNLVGCVECFFFSFGPSIIQYVNVVGKISSRDGEGAAGYRCTKEKER